MYNFIWNSRTRDNTIVETNICGLFVYFDCSCASELSIEERILENAFSAQNINKLANDYGEMEMDPA
jgi:hypothetical protein